MITWLQDKLQGRVGGFERKWRWFLITIFKFLLIPLSIAAALAFVWFAVSIFTFFKPDTTRGNALFVIEAVTNSLSFEVTEASREASFFVQGVQLISENKLVVDANKADDHKDRFCVDGWLEALPGSKIELTIIEGRQAARITDGSVVLSNGSRQFTLHDADPDENTNSPNALEIAPAPLPGDAPALVVEDLLMTGTLQIRDDPLCASDGGSGIAFAPRNEPLIIEGPGQIGQRTRILAAEECPATLESCDEGTRLRVIEAGRAYLTGQVDILAREKLCLDLLRGRACNGLFRLDAESVPLPSGASIQGALHSEFEAPTSLFGQVYFDGDFYNLNVWSNANWLALTFPVYMTRTVNAVTDQGASSSRETFSEITYNELRLSFLDQILTDAWLLAATTILLAAFGGILSVLQIELDMVPEEKTSKRKPEPILETALAERVASETPEEPEIEDPPENAVAGPPPEQDKSKSDEQGR